MPYTIVLIFLFINLISVLWAAAIWKDTKSMLQREVTALGTENAHFLRTRLKRYGVYYLVVVTVLLLFSLTFLLHTWNLLA